MKSASPYLSVSSNKGVVVISASYREVIIEFIGASCVASVNPGADNLSSFTIQPEKGKNGVIAVRFVYHSYSGKRDTSQSFYCLIPYSWQDEKVIVDLETPFISEAGKLGQITYDNCVLTLCLVVGGVRYVSPQFNQYYQPHQLAEARQKILDRGELIVDDPNLLCRYMVGQANDDELKAAARGETLMQRVQKAEIGEGFARTRLQVAEASNRVHEQLAEKAEAALRTAVSEAERLRTQCGEYRATIDEFANTIKRVSGENVSLEGKLSRIRAIIAKWRWNRIDQIR